MGVSTDGILAYGFSLGEDFDVDPLFEAEGIEDGEWDDLTCRKRGLPPWPEWDYESPQVQEFYQARKETLSGVLCEVFEFCSGKYPIYFVCIKASKYRVNRGSTTEIPDGLSAQSNWKQILKEYCDLMGFPYQEPKWLLTSYWG